MKPKDLAKIESSTSPYSVSLFIRTEKPYPERKDFENHIQRVLGRLETCLAESGCPEETKQERLKAVKQELSTLDHKDLLMGIALFVNEHIHHLFKLPVETRDAVVIDELFVIRELLLSVNKTYHYWLLTLSEPSIHLYHGKEDELKEYLEDEFPLVHLIQEAPLERTMSSSAVSAGVRSSASRSAGSTHLPGDYAADQDSYKEEHLKQFFRKAEAVLSNVLEEHPYPLILAGTERNLASFKEISKHHQNAAGFLNGSFNKTSLTELRELTLPIIEKHLSARCVCALEEFEDALGHKKTAQGIQEVWQTVQEGRCKVLMLEKDFYSFAGTTEGDMSLDLSLDRSGSSSSSYCFIPDNIEALIRKTRRMGGEIIFFERNQLKLYDRVAAILRY